MRILSATLMAVVLTGSAIAAPVDICTVLPSYQEMANRTISSVADYQKLASDFKALTVISRGRTLRQPYSLNIAATAQNYQHLAFAIKSVIFARLSTAVCP